MYILSLTLKGSIKPTIVSTNVLMPKGTVFIFDGINYEVEQISDSINSKLMICQEW